MRFADVAEEVVERLAPGGAVIVGNSVGGFSAARLAIRRPELVEGLVIVDGGGFAGRPPHVRAFCALTAQPWFLRRIYPSFAARYMRARTDADRRALAVGVATTRRDPGLRAVAELWRSFASSEHDLRARAPGREARGARHRPRPHTSDPHGFAAPLVRFADAAFRTPRVPDSLTAATGR